MNTLVELVRYLHRLQRYPYINYKRLLIPELQNDFVRFIAGETIMTITDGGELLIPQSLFTAWIDVLDLEALNLGVDVIREKYKALTCPECGELFIQQPDCDISLCPLCFNKDYMKPKASCINPHKDYLSS